MAAMAELDSLLQSLQTLKPPGVTPTKVKAITALCVDNIQVCRLRSPFCILLSLTLDPY
jgi:hypothetical protein